MNEVVGVVLEVVGGVSALLAGVYFLSKRLLTHLLEKDLESYKVELQHSASLLTEQIRHQNETAITEYASKISHLSNNQFDAIKSISLRLMELWAAIEQATLLIRPVSDEPNQSRAQRELEDIFDKSNKLLEEFKKYEIFFPNEFSEALFNFRSRLISHARIFGHTVIHAYNDETYRTAYLEFCDKISPSIGVIKDLRNELRKLIGVK